jgi:hypothetical protein
MNNQEIVRPKIDHNSSFRWLSIGPEKMFIKSRKGGREGVASFRRELATMQKKNRLS